MPSVLKESGYSYRLAFREYRRVLRRLFIAVALLFVLIGLGVIGYRQLMGWKLIDCLYMTVITIGTVGFREIAPLTPEAQLFTIFLIFGGLAVGGYAFGNIAAFFTEGQLNNILKGRRMVWEITNLKDHVIVCGYGKIGREVCRQLTAVGHPFIVIDKDESKIDEALEQDILAVIGDASEDEVLLKVGVRNARALVSAISDDSANVYLVLTARALNEKLYIVARGADETARKKLLRVGANQVVSPFEIGARRMAAYAVKAEMVDLVDALSLGGKSDLLVERIKVEAGSELDGVRLNESKIRTKTDGAMVIGVGTHEEKIEINPSADLTLYAGNCLLAIGTTAQLEALRKLAQTR